MGEGRGVVSTVDWRGGGPEGLREGHGCEAEQGQIGVHFGKEATFSAIGGDFCHLRHHVGDEECLLLLLH